MSSKGKDLNQLLIQGHYQLSLDAPPPTHPVTVVLVSAHKMFFLDWLPKPSWLTYTKTARSHLASY